jgi:hypothetical protein
LTWLATSRPYQNVLLRHAGEAVGALDHVIYESIIGLPRA